MKLQKITPLFILALTITSIAGKQTPVEINTTLNQFDSIMVTGTHSFFLRNVTIADSIKNRPLGFTRTGRKTSAPILCKPRLDTTVSSSLNGFLKNKHMAAQNDSSANFIMDLSVLNAKISEVSSGLTQTMSAQLTIEVKLINPVDTSIKKTLVIESSNSMETLDTTKKAAQIFRGAIEAFIQELVKSVPE